MKCQKSLKDEGVDLKTLIMDDNTTTFVRAKTAVSDQLKNCKDKRHILQNFCNSVYKVREVHMSVANISYLKKCFGYTPLNKIKAMRKEFAKIYQLLLLCFWPHGFNETLCGYIQNQDTYQHKSFNFAEITGEMLKASLSGVFSKHAESAGKL